MLTVLGFSLLGGYGALCGVVYKYQEKMIFFPDDYLLSDPASAGLTFRAFEIPVESDVVVTGWIVERNPAAPWILHFHGNAGNISHRVDHLALFHKLGYNGVVFDYRGYGKSTGIPNESGLIADGLAVVNYLEQEENVSKGTLFYFGESLGGGVASAVAQSRPPRAMILKSTFTSIPDMAADVYPFLPVRWLTRTKFSTKDKVPKFLFPKLIVHGQSDTVIPFEHGQRLYQLCSEPKEFLEVYGGHNTSPLELGEGFEEALKRFVDEAVPKE